MLVGIVGVLWLLVLSGHRWRRWRVVRGRDLGGHGAR